MTILSKACKLYNFESDNSLILSLANIRGFRSNFVHSKSFLQSKSLDILGLCETKLDDKFNSKNLPMRGYLPLI